MLLSPFLLTMVLSNQVDCQTRKLAVRRIKALGAKVHQSI